MEFEIKSSKVSIAYIYHKVTETERLITGFGIRCRHAPFKRRRILLALLTRSDQPPCLKYIGITWFPLPVSQLLLLPTKELHRGPLQILLPYRSCFSTFQVRLQRL